MARGRVIAAVGIYGVLGTAAWLGTGMFGRSAWHLPAPLGSSHAVALPIAALAGLLTGVAGVALSRVLMHRSRWGRALSTELQLGLSGVPRSAAAPLALSSAIGEELLFRGAIQTGMMTLLGPALGFVSSAAIFGLIHIPWNRRLLSWTLTAAVMGLVFGALYLATGELLAPILAHAYINHANLRGILQDPPREVYRLGSRM